MPRTDCTTKTSNAPRIPSKIADGARVPTETAQQSNPAQTTRTSNEICMSHGQRQKDLNVFPTHSWPLGRVLTTRSENHSVLPFSTGPPGPPLHDWVIHVCRSWRGAARTRVDLPLRPSPGSCSPLRKSTVENQVFRHDKK